MIRTLVTLGGVAACVRGVVTDNTTAFVVGALIVVLVVLSCRFSARGGEW